MNKSSFFIVVLLASEFLSYCSKSIEEMPDSDQTLRYELGLGWKS